MIEHQDLVTSWLVSSFPPLSAICYCLFPNCYNFVIEQFFSSINMFSTEVCRSNISSIHWNLIHLPSLCESLITIKSEGKSTGLGWLWQWTSPCRGGLSVPFSHAELLLASVPISRRNCYGQLWTWWSHKISNLIMLVFSFHLIIRVASTSISQANNGIPTATTA